jgi:Flp pilus assembly protein TadD
MTHRVLLVVALLVGAFVVSSCQSTPKRMVLPAPAGTNAAAIHHNGEGIHAYQQGQWESAKQHFGAAIEASPELAEAHYNLGMVLYRLGALREGDVHFVKAANLAPGNKIIWDSPPLKGVDVPEKGSTNPGMSSDGHMHSH